MNYFKLVLYQNQYSIYYTIGTGVTTDPLLTLIHCIDGVGIPFAVQVKFASCV